MLAATLITLSLAPGVRAATTGTVVGTVTETETGKPLSGVNVALTGTTLTTVSDSNGFYSFTTVTPGVYTVEASLVGHAPAEITGVDVQMDVATRVDVSLAPTVEEEPDVVVVQNRLLTAPDATQNLYTRTAKDQTLSNSAPNSLYQVPNIVSTVPGVVQDETGNLHIRGGRDDEIGWMIEGIPVTNPIDNTFGTNLVTVGMSRLQVYTGGYQAEYGNAISGILNEIKKTGSETLGGSIQATLGAQQHAGVYAEAGNVLPCGLDWYVGNYTWRSDFRDYIANQASSSDTAVKLVYPVTDRDRLSLLWTTGSARYTIPLGGPNAGVFTDQNHTNQGYGLAGLTWNHDIGTDASILLRPYYFLSKNDIQALATDLGDSADSRSIQRGIQAELRKSFGEAHRLVAGVWYTSASNSFRRYIPDLALQMTGDPAFAAAFDPFDYTSSVGTRQLSVFAQDKIRLSNQWVVDAGVRYDRMRYDKSAGQDFSDSQFSPRVGLAWSTDPRTVVRASYGRFIQFVPTSILDRQYTNPAWESVYASDAILDPERSNSYEISLERQFSSDAVLRVTPFYREYSDLIDRIPMDPTDPSSPYTFASVAEATARGVEVSVARKMGEGTTGWLSYTFARTRLPSMMNPGAWTFASWDQRHTVDATLQRSFGLAAGSIRLQYRSGLPWTEMSDITENDRRVSDNFVVTAGITRPLTDDPDSGVMGFHVFNLFNVDTATSQNPDGTAYTRVLPRFISLSYTQRW